MSTMDKLMRIALVIWTVMVGAFWIRLLQTEMEPGLATGFGAVAWILGFGVWQLIWAIVAMVRWLWDGS